MEEYDREIERLIHEPKVIYNNWSACKPLFKFCTPSGECETYPNKDCGCLTQVREGYGKVAFDDSLTDQIRFDERIHEGAYALEEDFCAERTDEERRRILQVYADYQRDMDDTIRKGLPWKANRSRVPQEGSVG